MKTKSYMFYEREMFATRCVWLLLEYPPPLLCENSNFLPAFFSRPYNSTRTGPQNHPHPGAPQKSWYLWDWGHSKVQKLQAVCSIHFLILPNITSWLVGLCPHKGLISWGHSELKVIFIIKHVFYDVKIILLLKKYEVSIQSTFEWHQNNHHRPHQDHSEEVFWWNLAPDGARIRRQGSGGGEAINSSPKITIAVVTTIIIIITTPPK